jgi:trk system potassium uptake protein TrkA
LEIVVHGDESNSEVVVRRIKDIKLLDGAVVGAIVRDNDLLMGSKKLVIEQGDHVLLMLTDVSKIHQVEVLFTENE